MLNQSLYASKTNIIENKYHNDLYLESIHIHMLDNVETQEACVLDYRGSLVEYRGISSAMCERCVMLMYTQRDCF